MNWLRRKPGMAIFLVYAAGMLLLLGMSIIEGKK